MDILSTSVGVLIGLVTTSLFRVIEGVVKKRVTVRSPDKLLHKILGAIK